MLNKIILILTILSASLLAQSQEMPYYLTAEAGAGYSQYITTLDLPDLDKNGLNGSFRIMWHPEHLLSIGLETGYWRLYSLETNASSPETGSSDISITMTSVPVMAVFSMKIFPIMIPSLEVKVSTGILLLTNEAEGFGQNLTSSQTSIGYSAAATYLFPLDQSFSLGES